MSSVKPGMSALRSVAAVILLRLVQLNTAAADEAAVHRLDESESFATGFDAYA